MHWFRLDDPIQTLIITHFMDKITCTELVESQIVTAFSVGADVSFSPDELHATLLTSPACPSSLDSCRSMQCLCQSCEDRP
jgi:hypothetical protein